MIVYLWDAGRWCGVSDSLRMDAGGAWVEETRLVDSARSLVRTYERSDHIWTAQRFGGTVTWVPSRGGVAA
jgi:hypothetical protein